MLDLHNIKLVKSTYIGNIIYPKYKTNNYFYLLRLFHDLVCVIMKMMRTKFADFKMKLIPLNKNLLMELLNQNTTQSVDHFILNR